MRLLSPKFRFGGVARFAVLLCAFIILLGSVPSTLAGDAAMGNQQSVPADTVSAAEADHMAEHMHMTSLRSAKSGDQQKARRNRARGEGCHGTLSGLP